MSHNAITQLSCPLKKQKEENRKPFSIIKAQKVIAKSQYASFFAEKAIFVYPLVQKSEQWEAHVLNIWD